jgi:hypothetical protein
LLPIFLIYILMRKFTFTVGLLILLYKVIQHCIHSLTFNIFSFHIPQMCCLISVLCNSVEQGPFSEADGHSVSRPLREPENLLLN